MISFARLHSEFLCFLCNFSTLCCAVRVRFCLSFRAYNLIKGKFPVCIFFSALWTYHFILWVCVRMTVRLSVEPELLCAEKNGRWMSEHGPWTMTNKICGIFIVVEKRQQNKRLKWFTKCGHWQCRRHVDMMESAISGSSSSHCITWIFLQLLNHETGNFFAIQWKSKIKASEMTKP